MSIDIKQQWQVLGKESLLSANAWQDMGSSHVSAD